MNGNISPCTVCEERFVGCHAECEVFKAWQNERKAQQNDKFSRNRREDLLNGFRKDAIQKTRRRRR